MIGRLTGMLWSGLLYFSFATVLSAALVAAYLAAQGRLTGERLARLVAPEPAPQPEAAGAQLPRDGPAAPQRQPSLEDVAAARALKMRDLELREQALAHALASLDEQRIKIVDERQNVEKLRTAFADELNQYRAHLTSEGAQNVQSIVENVKPKQAKQLLTEMIADGQMQWAVTLMAAMPTDKKKKVAAEFKTDEEAQQLREMLRLMDEGAPQNVLVDETEARLAAPAGRSN